MHGICRGIVRVAAPLAPRALRARWREEWLAEIDAAARSRGALRALGVALGAPIDALLSRRTMRAPQDGSGWRGPWQSDAKQTLRALLRSPWHVAAVTLCLGISIAVCTATFSILDSFVKGDYPGVRDGARLARFHLRLERPDAAPQDISSVTLADYAILREGSPSFAGVAAEGDAPFAVRVPGYEAMNVDGAFVSGNYFSTLGTQPSAGRLLQPSDDDRDAPVAVVISHAFWKGRLGSPADIVGRSMVIAGRDAFIAGIAPEHFSTIGGEKEPGEPAGVRIKVYVPLAHARGWPGAPREQTSWLRVYGRMKEGAGREQVSAELQPLAARIERPGPGERPRMRIIASPGRLSPDETLGDYMLFWVFFMAAPLTVLAIACANVANLQLVRANLRARELAVRVALGASRWQIIRLLTFEVALLAGVALGAAAAGAWMLLRTANLVLPILVSVNWRAAFFTVTVALVVIAATGLLPAMIATRRPAAGGLRIGGRSMTAGNSRTRRILVIAQVSLCFLLLLVAGVFTRGMFVLTGNIPPHAGQTLIAEMRFDVQEYSPAERRAFVETFDAQVRADRRVRAVGYSNTAPARVNWVPFSLAGGTDEREAAAVEVADGFFDASGVPLLRGRPLTWADAATLNAVVVDETFIEKFELSEPIFGQTLRLKVGPEPTHFTIVGVAAKGLQRPLLGQPRTTIYLPFVGTPNYVVAWIQTDDAVGLEASVRRIITGIDSDLPPVAVRTLANHYEVENQTAQLIAQTAGGLGAVSLLLAISGLYSVVAFFVALRTSEFGVRMALGARSGDIVRMVTGEGVRLVLTGLLASAAIAVPGLIALHSAFPFTQPFDPLVIVPTVLVLAVTAVAASAIPARRASTIQASVALRAE